MNLHALTVNMMLNLTASWLADDGFKTALTSAGPLGEGVIAELGKAHEPLAALQNNRRAAKVALRELIDQGTTLDFVHDRKARAVHFHLRALVEGSDDPKTIIEYRSLQALLFPNGLRVVNLPYIEEGGAAVALDRAVSDEVRAKLDTIKLGEHSLGDLFKAWIAAGIKIGKIAKQRAELEAALTRKGSATAKIDVKAGRTRWVQAVRGLLWAVEVSTELAALDEKVNAAIQQGITTSQRRWAAGIGGDANFDEDNFDDEDLDDEDLDDEELEDEDEPEDAVINAPVPAEPADGV